MASIDDQIAALQQQVAAAGTPPPPNPAQDAARQQALAGLNQAFNAAQAAPLHHMNIVQQFPTRPAPGAPMQGARKPMAGPARGPLGPGQRPMRRY